MQQKIIYNLHINELYHYQFFSTVAFFLYLLLTPSSPTMTPASTVSRSMRATVIPAANGATDLDELWAVTRGELVEVVSDWEGKDGLMSVAATDTLTTDALVGTVKIYILAETMNNYIV